MNTTGIDLLADAMDMGTEAGLEPQQQSQADGEVDPMYRAVEIWAERECPVNTNKAYNSKMAEFVEYCNQIHSEDNCPTLMTSNKVFPFMLYQIMRDKRPGGPRKNTDSGGHKHFRMEEYKAVSALCCNYVAELEEWVRNGRRGEEPYPPESCNPSGFSNITHYKNGLKKLHSAQVSWGWDVAPWDLVWTQLTSTLSKISNKRRERINRSQYKEKRGSTSVMQYTMLMHIPKIEEEMWNRKADFRSSVTWMRNRLFFLFTFCGVMRGETLFQMQMSDLALVTHKNENMLHPMTVLLAQFSTGKTNKDNQVSFGRAARHHDVRSCPVGGLAFYLAMRFVVSREFDDPIFLPRDFLDNRNWFDIMLLVDPYELPVGQKATIGVSYDTYYKELVNLLKDMDLPSNIVAHLGRHLGHRTLETREVEDSDIDKLGNWNQEKPRGRFYSTNLPYRPLRQMAMASQKSKYYVPRTVVVEGIEPLLRETPFTFIYNVLQFKKEMAAENQHTVLNFVGAIEELNTIFVQDAAAMWVKYPERRNHPIYTLRVFQMPQWEVRISALLCCLT